MTKFSLNAVLAAQENYKKEAETFRPHWVKTPEGYWKFIYSFKGYFLTLKNILEGKTNLPTYLRGTYREEAEKEISKAFKEAFEAISKTPPLIMDVLASYAILQGGLLPRYHESPAIGGKLGRRLAEGFRRSGLVPSAAEQLLLPAASGPYRIIPAQAEKAADLIGSEIYNFAAELYNSSAFGRLYTNMLSPQDFGATWFEAYSNHPFSIKQAAIGNTFAEACLQNGLGLPEVRQPKPWEISQSWKEYILSETQITGVSAMAEQDRADMSSGYGHCWTEGAATAAQERERWVTEHTHYSEYAVTGNTVYRTIFSLLILPVNPELSAYVAEALGAEPSDEEIEKIFENLQRDWIPTEYRAIQNPMARRFRAVAEKHCFEASSAAKKLRDILAGKEDEAAWKAVVLYGLDNIKDEGRQTQDTLPFIWNVSEIIDCDWKESQKAAKAEWLFDQFSQRYPKFSKFSKLVREACHLSDEEGDLGVLNTEKDDSGNAIVGGFDINRVSVSSDYESELEVAANAIEDSDYVETDDCLDDCPF